MEEAEEVHDRSDAQQRHRVIQQALQVNLQCRAERPESVKGPHEQVHTHQYGRLIGRHFPDRHSMEVHRANYEGEEALAGDRDNTGLEEDRHRDP